MVFSVVLLVVFSINLFASQPLTFEERVKAQEAIERVYYSHRIWPKENPQPKPPFEQMVTREQIEAKVTDYLKKSAALDQFWQRPITGEQLQEEMDRMAKGTKDPAILNELFAALDRDPYLIAECLARPILADRLCRNWYANDKKFHKEAKEKAEKALQTLTSENFCGYPEGQYSKVTYRLQMNDQALENLELTNKAINLSQEEFDMVFAGTLGEGRISGVQEKNDSFVITHTIFKSEAEIQIENLSFQKQGLENWFQDQCSISSFEEPIVANGEYFIFPILESSCTDNWAPTSTGINVPSARYYHTAVWTGAEMIIWGGYDGANCLSTGGKYNPTTDSWISTSTGTNVPSAREVHTAIWTGTEMIIWGGNDGSIALDTGGRYNPITDIWLPTSTSGVVGKEGHSVVWTGLEMIVWGGRSGTTYYNTGYRYNPINDSWTATSTGTNVPVKRVNHSAVWTGTEMIVWGGYYIQGSTSYIQAKGGKYNPSTDSWQTTSTGTNCPVPRVRHTAVWTGSEMIIWGGVVSGSFNTGGRYNPLTDTWLSTSIGTNVPSARYAHAVVWSGAEMIVWGGYNGSTYFNTGGRYNPLNDSWLPTSTGTNVPSARPWATGVWTGSKMIIWGGSGNTGGIYDPGFVLPSVSGSHTNSCPSMTVTISVPEGFVSYQWIKDTVDISGATASSYIVSCSGTYSVRVTDSNGCNGTSLTYVVTISPEPTIEVLNPLCVPLDLSTQPYQTYQWYRNGIIISDATAQSYNVVAPGTYTVAVTTASGCGATSPGVIAYSNPSTPTIFGTSVGCGSVALSTGTYATYQWIKNSVDIPGANSKNYSAVESGTYTVRVGNAGGCTATSAGKSVTVYQKPNPTIIGADNGCDSVSLSTEVYASYQWILDGADIPGATGENFDATQSGTYSVRVTSAEGCISTSGGKAVTVYVSPAPTVIGADNGCGAVSLTTEAASAYQWIKDSLDIPGALSQNYNATQSGSYSVRVTGSGGCIATSAGKSVTVNAVPNPSVTGASTGCDTIALTTQAYASYQWIKDGIDIPGATGENFDATQSGTYSVRVTSAEGCTSTSGGKAVTVYVSPAPTVIGADNGCGAVSLTTETASTYQWIKDGIDIPGAISQNYNATQSGLYRVRVVSAEGCAGTSSGKSVTVNPNPVPAISGDHFNTCPETKVVLTTTESYETYQWYLNGSPISGGISQTLNAVVSGNYKVSVTNSFGCSAITANYQVFVDFCPETEVSPSGAEYPVKLVKDGNSFTGFYLYFQKLDTLDGYNIYEGDIVSPWDGYYHHDNKPGSICSASIVDLGTGQMRAEITPSAGNHYYLVTAYGGGVEGPSGFNSDNVEIDPLQSTCSP